MGVLFQVGGALALFFGLVQFTGWLRWRNPASLWWTAANCVGTLGATLMLGRGFLPDWASQTLGNTLILAAILLIWLGFRRLAGEKLRPDLALAAAVAFLLIFEALRQLAHDLAARILFSSLALGLVNARTSYDLARAWPGQSLRLRNFLVWLFALHALFYLFRSVTAVTVEAGADFLTTAGVQSATLLCGVVEVLAFNTASLWMAAERPHRTVPLQIAA